MSTLTTCRSPHGVPSIEYADEDARCMDCGTFITFGDCGSGDCPEVACTVCLTGCTRLLDL